MRYKSKKRAEELLLELYKAFVYLQKSGEEPIQGEWINDCRVCLRKVRDIVQRDLPMAMRKRLFVVLRELESPREPYPVEQWRKFTEELIMTVQDIPAPYRAVFFPYKAAMWTSLESVWREFTHDPDWETAVVPIRYWDLDAQQRPVKEHYEGNRFPPDVPIVSYREYDLAQNPDVAFIHYPYDDVNSLSRIDEKFFSRNLVRYTDHLCYIPYFITRAVQYNLAHKVSQFDAPGHRNAWRIFVQSEKFRQSYIDYEHEPERIVAAGSPKIDHILRLAREGTAMPSGWAEKLGRPTPLRDVHISEVVWRGKDLLGEWRREMEMFVGEAGAVIWRPHPMMRACVQLNRPGLLAEYDAFMAEARAMPHVILDEQESYDAAFAYSAFLWGGVSLVPEYMAMGKPIQLPKHWIKNKNMETIFSCESAYSCNTITDKDAVETRLALLRGEDPKKEERWRELQKGLCCDGLSGRRIYEYVTDALARGD